MKDADVFLQAYRPGGLKEKGFGPQELAQLRPGIVCAGLTAYGWEGPWKDKRGVIHFPPFLFTSLPDNGPSLVRFTCANCYGLQLCRG